MSDLKGVTLSGISEQIQLIYGAVMEHSDPRTKGLFLTDSVFYPIGIILVYLFVVQIVVPWIDKKYGRQIEFDKIMSCYNLFMFGSNFLMGFMLVWYSFNAGHSMDCQPVHSRNKHVEGLETRLSRLMWFYYALKIIELSDTVFLVLKKKQIPTVYIYHHASMVFAAWIAVKFVPGGSTVGFSALNSWAHVALYIHYKLTELNIRIRLGQGVSMIAGIQMFVSIMIWSMVVMTGKCGYPDSVCIALFMYMASFMYFFVPCLMKKFFGRRY